MRLNVGYKILNKLTYSVVLSAMLVGVHPLQAMDDEGHEGLGRGRLTKFTLVETTGDFEGGKKDCNNEWGSKGYAEGEDQEDSFSKAEQLREMDINLSETDIRNMITKAAHMEVQKIPQYRDHLPCVLWPQWTETMPQGMHAIRPVETDDEMEMDSTGM